MLGHVPLPQPLSHKGVHLLTVTALPSHSVRMEILPWFLFSPSHWKEEELVKSIFDLGMQSSYFKD